MESFDDLLAHYDYAYPESAVALEPSVPRDAARLLIMHADGTESDDAFRNLAKHLPPRSVLVLNETKVIPARVEATKPTGGKVRLLFVRDAGCGEFFALADRPIDPGMRLAVTAKVGIMVVRRVGAEWLLHAVGVRNPMEIFRRHGLTPIPPYLKKTQLGEKALREKYQAVFAKREGSVAAPTASLHFTPRLLAALKRAGHDIVKVTLHVNLGTFAPLTPEHVSEGRLHQETFEIPAATAARIARARAQGRPIIAVGTTACRALESAADAEGNLTKRRGDTRLFVRPGYRFKIVDGLITNFHVPKSSLLMLVAAMVGRERLIDGYRRAIARGYRIFSFGDGMLILPTPKRD
jgi:S-adenosylmethionine:tRNA ribosyltransferase-isomerase